LTKEPLEYNTDTHTGTHTLISPSITVSFSFTEKKNIPNLILSEARLGGKGEGEGEEEG
jgi:hypothetical protein